MLLINMTNTTHLEIPIETEQQMHYWKNYISDSAILPDGKLDYQGYLIGNKMYQLYKLGGVFYLQSDTDTFQLPEHYEELY